MKLIVIIFQSLSHHEVFNHVINFAHGHVWKHGHGRSISEELTSGRGFED